MPRRYCARNPGHQAQQERTCEQNDGIARVAFCPLPQDRIQAQRERQTDPNSAPHTPQSRRKHDPKYVAALGAQGHANAEPVGPLRHCVGDHAVKPDRRQSQCQAAKYSEDPRRQVLLLPLLPIGDPGVQILRYAVTLMLRVHRRQLHRTARSRVSGGASVLTRICVAIVMLSV